MVKLTTGCLYLVGSYLWSSFTAIYRVIYLKAQSWLNKVGGERKLLKVFLLAGFTLLTIASLWLTLFDPRNSSEKMCNHYSNEVAVLFYTHQVIWYKISNRTFF